VIVPTDVDDDALERTVDVAAELARRHGFAIVLYDRSNERWTDTPHSKGPTSVAELEGSDRHHVVEQLQRLEAAGITANAWLATVPAISAMVDALQQLDVDGVLVPENFSHPTMMDRLEPGSGPAEILARIGDLHLEHPPTVFMLTEDDELLTVGVENGAS
jgi:hypothetical protein